MEKIVILLIDDDEMIRDLAVDILESSMKNIEIEVKTDPRETLLHPFYDIVISDFRMPGMNGVDFIREIKRFSPTTVGILMSGNDVPNMDVEGFEVVDIFVPKLELTSIPKIIFSILRNRDLDPDVYNSKE